MGTHTFRYLRYLGTCLQEQDSSETRGPRSSVRHSACLLTYMYMYGARATGPSILWWYIPTYVPGTGARYTAHRQGSCGCSHVSSHVFSHVSPSLHLVSCPPIKWDTDVYQYPGIYYHSVLSVSQRPARGEYRRRNGACETGSSTTRTRPVCSWNSPSSTWALVSSSIRLAVPPVHVHLPTGYPCDLHLDPWRDAIPKYHPMLY